MRTLAAALLFASCSSAQTFEFPGTVPFDSFIPDQQTGDADRAAPVATPPPVQSKYKFPTTKAFLHDFLISTFGPEGITREAFGAAKAQLVTTPPEWGQGWGAFGERFASSMGYHMVRMSTQYMVAAALKEDNHYYRLGYGTFQHRALHAALHPARAHHRDGSYALSISSFTGLAAGGIVSRSWLPPSQQGASDIVGSILISYAVSAGFDEAREFLPDLMNKIRHKQ